MSLPYLVDTNILLRFLTGEPAAQASAVKKLFARAGAGELVLEVTAVIVAETIYTLVSYYGIKRQEAVEKIAALLRQPGFKVRESPEVFSALERLCAVNVGFADAYLAASGAGSDIAIASFDRDFHKFKDVRRFDPLA